MLKCYRKCIEFVRHDERLYLTKNTLVIKDEITDDNDKLHTTEITWDNCETELDYGVWSIIHTKHGRVAYLRDAYFPFARERLGQPIDIIKTVTYSEAIVSIDDIVKYGDGETAIQYLIERGLSVSLK